jgi:hypothetical protein
MSFYDMATRNVKLRLKAPSTAVFPPYDAKGVSYQKGIDDCTYIVRGFVDAQNSFSAMIRSTWMVTVWYDHHDDKTGGDWYKNGFPVIDE